MAGLLPALAVQAGTVAWNGGACPGDQSWGNITNWAGLALPTDVAGIPGGSNGTNTPDLKGNSYTINQLFLGWNNGSTVYLYGNGSNVVGGLLTLTGSTGIVVLVNNGVYANLYGNLALGMPTRTSVQKWIASSNASLNTLWDYSLLSGTGTLFCTTGTYVNQTPTFFFSCASDTNGPTFNGDTILDQVYLTYYSTNMPGSANFRFGRNAPVGSDTWGGTITMQPIALNQGSGSCFRWCPTLSVAAFPSNAVLQNDFVLTGMPYHTFFLTRGSLCGSYPAEIWGGKLTLGGRLTMQAANDSTISGATSQDANLSASNFQFFTNGITLAQNAAAREGIVFSRSTSVTIYLSGAISDGPGQYQNPICLVASGGNIQLGATNSTYKYGTIIGFWDSGYNQGNSGLLVDNHNAYAVNTAATNSMGSGNVTLLAGGRLYLQTSNVLNAAQQLILQGNVAAMPTVSLVDNNGTLPTIPAASKGVIAVVGNSSNNFNNLVATGIGDGVYLGAGMANGTFYGSSLHVGADGNYRLGGGGDNNGIILTIANSNVLSGANNVLFGQPCYQGSSYVTLNGTNSYTGATTLYGSLLAPMGPVYTGTIIGSNTSFGATNGAVTLVGGRMLFAGHGVSTKGVTTFTSESSIEHSGNLTGLTNVFTALVRSNNGVLHLRRNDATYFLGAQNMITVGNTNAGQVVVNNMVAPYQFYDQNGTLDFATFAATSGFTKVSYGTNLLMSMSAPTDLVYQTQSFVGTNCWCYAMRTTVALTNILSGTPVTISNGSGGLILGGNIGTNINLDFNGSEANIYNANNYTIFGVITNTGGYGLTKSGGGDLTLTNVNNCFTGPFTINNGAVYGLFDADNGSGPGSFGPYASTLVLNGGYLGLAGSIPAGYTTLSSNRTIYLAPEGGAIGFPKYNQSAFTVNSWITGPGGLYIPGGYAAFTINNASNNYAGGTIMSDGNNPSTIGNIGPGGTLGSGPVIIFGDRYTKTVIYFSGNSNLYYAAGNSYLPVQITGHSFVTFRSPAPVMGALTGDGDVILGWTAGVTNTTLTVGLDNSDFSFYGYIYQNSSTTDSVIKAGTGTWNLYGAQQYLGPTVVTNGTLNLMGSVASNLVVSPGGTLTGMGLVGGSLTLNGTYLASTSSQITVTGNITLGGALTIPNGLKVTSLGSYVLTTLNGTISGKFATVPPGLMVRTIGNSLQLRRQGGTDVFFR